MKSFFIKVPLLFLCFGIVSSIYTSPCFGQARQRQGKFGLGIKNIISSERTQLSDAFFSDAFVVGARYWLSDDLSLDGNFGIRYLDPDEGEDRKRFLMGAGLNRYLMTSETFNPFIGVDLSVVVSDPGPDYRDDSSTTLGLDGKFGGEYFFTQRFSLSGAVLFRFQFGDDTEVGTDGRLGFLFYLD